MKFYWILYVKYEIFDRSIFQLCFCIGNAKQLYFISALATHLAFLRPTCSCYVCFVLSLHFGTYVTEPVGRMSLVPPILYFESFLNKFK